jgi:hypothetical protein
MVIGVFVPPGHTQLARMPSDPYWAATNRVKATTPPLDAV